MVSAPAIPVFGVGDIYPVVSGGQKAAYHLYGALNRLTACRYVFLDPGFDGLEEGSYPNGLPFTRIGGLSARSWRNSWIAPKLLYRDGPTRYILRAARTAALVQRFKHFVDASPVMVLTAFPWMWALLEGCAEGKWVVFDSFNFEYQLGLDRLAAGTIDARSLAVQRELECKLSRRADLLLACSSFDAGSYVQSFGVEPEKIHTGFKGTEIPPQPPHRDVGSEPVAIFVGSDWGPNNEAALAIVREFAPRLPEVRFKIIGGCCRSLPPDLPGNVEALGFVQDLERELATARIALNPMRSGSGINMKLLEYLAMGLPIVSTEFGLRGLEEDAVAAIKVAPMEAFCDAIDALLHDPAAMAVMSTRGYAHARDHLDWGVIAQRFAGMIRPAQASK